MPDIFHLADQNQAEGRKVLEITGVIPAWESIGATVHLVGSLETGLLMKNRDIDLHIYTRQLCITESFTVMQFLAEKLSLREIHYGNLIDTEEECIEWHTFYNSPSGSIWKFDMIHIRQGSKYDGVVEKVTEALKRRLIPETRRIILQIKYEVPDSILIPGIEIYHAVLEGGVKNYEELQAWRQTNPLTDSLAWMP